MGERSIEVKVGALILVSLGLLVAFILVLGRVTTTEGFNLNVLFVHPGPLQPGAPVKIAGSEVGYVDSMTYLGRDGPFMPVAEGQRPDAPPRGLAGARRTHRIATLEGKWLFDKVGWCRIAVGCGAQEGGYLAYLQPPCAVDLTDRGRFSPPEQSISLIGGRRIAARSVAATGPRRSEVRVGMWGSRSTRRLVIFAS